MSKQGNYEAIKAILWGEDISLIGGAVITEAPTTDIAVYVNERFYEHKAKIPNLKLTGLYTAAWNDPNILEPYLKDCQFVILNEMGTPWFVRGYETLAYQYKIPIAYYCDVWHWDKSPIPVSPWILKLRQQFNDVKTFAGVTALAYLLRTEVKSITCLGFDFYATAIRDINSQESVTDNLALWNYLCEDRRVLWVK